MKLLSLAALLPLAGCHKITTDPNGPDGGTGPGGRVQVARVPVVKNTDVDLLFVVDDSPSMLDKQTNLKNNFPNFINVLNALQGGLPSIHLGVVTTDLGTKGADDAVAGPSIGSGPGSCSGNGKSGNLVTNGSTLVNGTFISDVKNTDGTRTTNYTGTLANAFAAIASVGASGCGFEQPIEAAKRALNNNAANAGFLRPAANLAIIFVGDEDDCSISHSTLLGSDTATLGPLQSFRCTRFGITCDTGGMTSDAMNMVGMKDRCHSNESSAYLTKVASYVTFFQGLKADPEMVMAAGLFGATTPVGVELVTPPGGGSAVPALSHSCTYTGAAGPELADPGIRLAQLLDQFTRHSATTVCQQDLSGGLVAIAQQVRSMTGDPCLTEAIATPPDCIVRDERGGVMTDLPACSTAVTTDCYQLVSDAVACPAGSQLRLAVTRSAMPAAGTVTAVYCKL